MALPNGFTCTRTSSFRFRVVEVLEGINQDLHLDAAGDKGLSCLTNSGFRVVPEPGEDGCHWPLWPRDFRQVRPEAGNPPILDQLVQEGVEITSQTSLNGILSPSPFLAWLN